MKFTVLWKKAAEDALVEIWLGASDRDVISQAARNVDEQLAIDAHSVGESRPEGKRILIVAPLGVKFQVYGRDRVV